MKNSFQFLSMISMVAFLLLMACKADRTDADVTITGSDTTAMATYDDDMRDEKMSAENTIESWSAKPQEAANAMIQKYGQPDDVTERALIWYDNGPWKKTIVSKEEIKHDFPMAHTDMLEQFIDYKVPVDKFDDLAEYDGSVMAERTKGVISARCDKEEMNFLALNLAHDIIAGKKSVQEARDFYAKTAMAFMNGEKDPYTQGLQFAPASGATTDADMPAKM